MRKPTQYKLSAVIFLVVALGLLTLGCIKENLWMGILGFLCLVLGVLMITAGPSLIAALLGRIAGLIELGPKGAKFSEGTAIIIGGEVIEDSESSDGESYPAIDSERVTKDLEEGGIKLPKETTERIWYTFLNALRTEEIVIEEEDESNRRIQEDDKAEAN